MSFLSEEEVYLGAKVILKRAGWQVVAGQPARGTDNLPVVEVKSPDVSEKGSLGSYKPDIIAIREGSTLLVEAKPQHDSSDANKLIAMVSNQGRLALLYQELVARGIVKVEGDPGAHLESFQSGVIGALANSDTVAPRGPLFHIRVRDPWGTGMILPPPAVD